MPLGVQPRCCVCLVLGFFSLASVCSTARLAPSPQWDNTEVVTVAARVLSVQAGCSTHQGIAMAQLAAEGLSKETLTDFANGSSCFFVSWPILQTFLSLHNTDIGIPYNNSSEYEELVQMLEAAQSSSAILTPVESLDIDGSQQFFADCSVGPELQNVGVVLVMQNMTDTNGSRFIALSEIKLERTILEDVQPSLGPASGGTDIYIKGEGLDGLVTCLFDSESTSINVTAVLVNSTTAICVAPGWPPLNRTVVSAGSGSTQGVQVMLSVASSDCTLQTPFEYYVEPEIMGVFPRQGPRYGSFQLMVDLGAKADLASLNWAELGPTVRIAGADLNGSDLVLSANWTSDGQGLVTETPIERTPLAAGVHQIHISFNGQYTEEMYIDSTTLTVEGPALYMAQAYYGYTNSTTSVRIGVYLMGMSTLPVTANLTVVQRSMHGNVTSSDRNIDFDFWLEDLQLSWEAGETGWLSTLLHISGDTRPLASGGLLVAIDSAENADIDYQNSTSLISALGQDQLIVGFALHYNQVAYRGENASIPVDITNAAMRLPASVQYQIVSTNGQVPDYIVQNATLGVLEWDLEPGSEMELDIQIDWDLVDLQLEDHLMILLTPVWNSKVPEVQRKVALHVFGVEEGQCPPGTFWDNGSLAPNPVVPSSAQSWLSPAGAPLAWLQALVVHGGANWSFDLSSQFQSNVSDYGVIVPAEFDNVTLCTVPFEEATTVTVHDGSGSELQPVAAYHPSLSGSAQMPPGLVPVASGGKRRVLAAAPGLPAPSSPQISQTSVSALSRKSRECRGLSWGLDLYAGQNDFIITTMKSGQPIYPSPPPLSKPKNGSSSTSPTRRVPSQSPQASAQEGTYTLSVVRLADPNHAELTELNVTEGNSSYPICNSGGLDDDVPACLPDDMLQLNVSSEVSFVTLHPALRYPDIQNLRVEVAGQVLSRGGNVGADQLADTSATLTNRENTDFLPLAYIVGLQHGIPVTVPIVIVAEDGVTSLRYYVSVLREGGSDAAIVTANSLENLWDGGPSSAPYGSLDNSSLLISNPGQLIAPPPPLITSEWQTGWPVAPSQEPWCHACPAGWATTAADQSHCSMCTPGSFAQSLRSAACSQCPLGTYANSWGSSHCNHCIIGTFAPYQGSRLCYMCPENMTNLEDGSSNCNEPVRPGTNLTMRYAVIVSFGVYLNGTTLDEIASKVGVNASSQLILERLIRSDTATAFNITSRDVNVTGISQIGRRVLLVNVSATLGVDLPTNSSNDDVTAELAVKNLSADEAIDLMAFHPDRFWVRTTKALDVTAEAGSTPPTRKENIPSDLRRNSMLPWYGMMFIVLGAASVSAIAARIWRKRLWEMWLSVRSRWRSSRSHRLVEVSEGSKADPLQIAKDDSAASRPDGTKLISRGRGCSANPD